MLYYKKIHKTNITYPNKTFQPSDKFEHEPVKNTIISSPELCMKENSDLEKCLKTGNECKFFIEILKKCTKT